MDSQGQFYRDALPVLNTTGDPSKANSRRTNSAPSNAASDENADNDKKDVAVKAEVELSEDKKGSTEATQKNRESVQETAEEETAWEEDPKKKQVDPNLDGLILLGCIVGLVLFIVILRYVCCTIEQCEETLKAKRSLATKDTCKVEHTEREIIMLGMKYKSLV
ncbi:hypothetical protein OS493_025343 [Desmophyllum pertusum]|uniref:Uncharacterized protein n=1 Tax=Desmophyllum pertusum TaxID=174260 RepID=A0A9X0CWD6_9CNID|nr:hypothetical protein OS493_025343 [Desmophyllum pertusum]